MKTLLAAVVVFASILGSGCHTSMPHKAIDVPLTGYSLSQVFVVNKAVFIEKTSDGSRGDVNVLTRPGWVQNGPNRIEDYKAGNKSRWPRIRGLLERGTNLKIAEIKHRKNFELGHVYSVFATVLDGEMTGLSVELGSISEDVEDPATKIWVPVPDPQFLSKVSPE